VDAVIFFQFLAYLFAMRYGPMSRDWNSSGIATLAKTEEKFGDLTYPE
jgi:hypothetical protein